MNETNSVQATKKTGAAEIALWYVITVAAGIFLIGAGLVISLVGTFTRMKNAAPGARWGLLGVGVATLLLQIVYIGAAGS